MKKIFSFLLPLLTVATVAGLFPTVAFAAEERLHDCNSTGGGDCIVCDVAEKINELPEADGITVENAAVVIDQIHAIDRIKGNLTDEQYEELLTLVECDNDGSGHGVDVPVRYMNVVEEIQKFGGNSLYIAKTFVAADGSTVNVDEAEVQFEVTNVDTKVSTVLTMATMPYDRNSLSANSDFYSENETGWTYQYILPAGTYTIKEISDSGATVNGEEFVTTSTLYTVNGTETTGSATVTVEDGGVSVLIKNVLTGVTFSAVDSQGSFIPGAKFQILDRDEEVVQLDGEKVEWTSDANTYTVSGLPTGIEYTLYVDGAPEGYYKLPQDDITFTINEMGKVFSGEEEIPNGAFSIGFEKTVVKISTEDSSYDPLAGATLQILDSEGEVVQIDGQDTWISTEEPRVVEGLKVGEEYTLQVVEAPAGYHMSQQEDITFTINEDGTIDAADSENIISVDFSVNMVQIWTTVPGVKFEITYKNTSDETVTFGEPSYEIGDICTLQIGEFVSGVDYTIKFTEIPEEGLWLDSFTFSLTDTGELDAEGIENMVLIDKDGNLIYFVLGKLPENVKPGNNKPETGSNKSDKDADDEESKAEVYLYTDSVSTSAANIPETGDSSQMMLWTTMMIVSLGAIGVMSIGKKRN